MRVRVATGLVCFSFFIAFALGTTVAFIVDYQTDKSMLVLEKNRVESEVDLVISGMNTYLQTRKKVLTDHSNFSVVRQSVMQPEQMFFYLQDFMADITVLGDRFKETVVDFEGRTVFSNQQSVPDYTADENVINLLNGQKYLGVSLSQRNKAFYWTLVEPVFYQGVTEGAIIIEIPFSQILDALELSSKFDGEILSSEDYPEGRWELGAGINDDRVYTRIWEPYGLVFKVVVNETTSGELRSEIVNNIVLAVMLAAIVIALLAFVLGDRFFARPIRYLGSRARQLIDNNEDDINQPVQLWKETQDVSSGFDHMLNVVHNREQQLKDSLKELRESNIRLQESQAQLVQSEKMAGLGTMAAGIAHEINNPIGFVSSNISTLQDYLNDFNQLHLDLRERYRIDDDAFADLAKKSGADFALEDSAELVKESVEGLNRVTEIVSSLKSFSRSNTEDQAEADINAGIRSTLRLLNNEIKYHCTLHEEYGELPPIYCNIGQINQVIVNLIVNAAQAISGEGDIFVSTRADGKKIFISIRDTGKGIPAEIQEDIFNPFFTTKPPGEGTGLGLSVSHGIILQHKGDIQVISEQDKGTEFIITLPVRPE